MLVPDKVERITAPIELENFSLHNETYRFVEKNPIELTITNLGKKKLLIEGSTKLVLMIPCSRCLSDVETTFHIDISKEIDFSKTKEEQIEELDEMNYINGYDLDVDVLVYGEMLIDFPMKVLCKEDCKGFCNVCGMNLNKGTCSCESTNLDPRMSVILDIFNNSK
jgi:uncharacterized protein